jgi:uncharacterized iron-regulated protein
MISRLSLTGGKCAPVAGKQHLLQALLKAVVVLLIAALSQTAGAEEAAKWDLMKDHPLNETVWTGDGKPADFETMLAQARSSRYVLIGENHDNPDHHRIQAQIIAALAVKDRHPAIVFEMIPPSYQERLDSFVQQTAPDDSKLGEILDWEERGWPDWNIYRPIAREAVTNRLPMLAGGVERGVVKRLAAEGPDFLPQEKRKAWGLDQPLEVSARADLLTELEDAHCGVMPKSALGYMIPVQRARDGALASATLEGSAMAGSAVMIAGNGHVRKDRGAPVVLARLDPGASMLAIGLYPVRAGKTAFSDYLDGSDQLPFDYVIFTDASEPKDHCADLKARFGKRQ